jgi:hypothetical protein
MRLILFPRQAFAHILHFIKGTALSAGLRSDRYLDGR